MNKRDYNLWLEFEAMQWNNWDPADDFCNIAVEIPDSRCYGINVWTYQYFLRAIRENEAIGENLDGLYIDPPDLFVRALTRDCIDDVISELISKGDLEDLLNPSVFNFRYPVSWTEAEAIPDLGKKDLAILESKLKPGHPLYNRKFWLEAKRDQQLVLQLNDKTIALVFQGGQFDDPGFPVTEFFGDKRHFWTTRIKNK